MQMITNSLTHSSADTMVNCYRDVKIFIDRITAWDLISEQLAELVNARVWIFSRELEPQMLVRKFILYRFASQYPVTF